MNALRPRFAAMMAERPPTPREELANALSHGLGLFLVLGAALPTLIVSALRRHDPWQMAGGLIFGLSLAALYGTSTLYHLLPVGRAKWLCRLLDHAAIYLLIAGSYTPFALGVLRGWLGSTVLIVVWTLAALGIALKLKDGFRHPLLSTGLYLLMGWLVVIILHPLVTQVGWAGFAWLAAGGLFYSLGVIFYLWEQLHYSHAWWHGFVLAGSACHCAARDRVRRRALALASGDPVARPGPFRAWCGNRAACGLQPIRPRSFPQPVGWTSPHPGPAGIALACMMQPRPCCRPSRHPPG